jgi:hypothetical protein
MWPYKSLLVVLAVVVAASLAFLYGTTSWAGKADLLRMRLEEAREPVRVGRFDERELTGLPAPVQRYFRTALTPGQPMILSARFRHRGEFNMGDAEPNWKPFRSRQFVVVRRPGFVWEARIAVWPGLQAHVHDAYVAGVGMLPA